MAKWDIKALTFAGLGAAVLTAAALPQTALAQAAEQDPPWIKICQTDPESGKEMCLVGKELIAPTGQFIAAAQLRQFTGENEITFVVAVPPGMLIQPGLRVQVDGGTQHEVAYEICFVNQCMGSMKVEPAFVDAMKAGGQLTISALNQAQTVIAVPLSLIGFTKIYDGEGLDPQGAQAVQNELRQALQQRAAEAAERLKEQQQSGN